MKAIQYIISTDATIYDADGFETRKGVTVMKRTDEDGEFLIIGSTLHSMSDFLEEEEGRFTLLCTGGTLVL